MKTLAALLILSFAQATFANTQEIAACSTSEIASLKETINEKKADGFINVKLMKNMKKQTVGFYSWDLEGNEIYATLCEQISTRELTVASDWYYWHSEDGSSNPAAFELKTYDVFQDEGLAQLEVIKTSVNGNVTFEMSVMGWNSAGEDVVVRKSLLTLE